MTLVPASSSRSSGGGSQPDTVISIFSAQLQPLDTTPVDFTGGSIAFQTGANLAVAGDGSGVDILADGSYVIELDITVRVAADSVGVAIPHPVFTGSSNWISDSEGGTFWIYCQAALFGIAANPEQTRTFPPVVLAAGDKVGVAGFWQPGQGDGVTPPTFDALLTIVQTA